MSRMWIGLIALTLTGCLSMAPERWARVEDDAFVRATHDCKQQVGAQLWNAAYFGGVIVPIVALVRRPAMMRECMAAQGFAPRP